MFSVKKVIPFHRFNAPWPEMVPRIRYHLQYGIVGREMLLYNSLRMVKIDIHQDVAYHVKFVDSASPSCICTRMSYVVPKSDQQNVACIVLPGYRRGGQSGKITYTVGIVEQYAFTYGSGGLQQLVL
ncbi:hypothetical protein DFH28DRAFT_921485 [Melampsora americana]|nr:hypothetical protein DFH28DRAFT_921485 [Melampsora americana]